MHILFVLEHFHPHIGGVEVLFGNLILGLRQKGHTITVLTTRFNSSLPSYEMVDDHYCIYRVGHNRYDFMFFALGLGRKLAKQADIIHTTTYNGIVPAWILGKILHKKVVVTVHEIFGHLRKQFVGRRWPLFRMAEWMLMRFPFQKYICVSDYTKHMLHDVEHIPMDKMITIHNGIDYTQRQPSVFYDLKALELRKQFGFEDSYIGFFFGRPGISKGLEYFIRAIPLIVTEIPQFMAYLLVAKDDNARYSYVRGLAQSLGVDTYIYWGEKVPYNALPSYIAMADVTVVPSLTEGFGFAAVEACSMGKPVVVSHAGSLPEVVSGKVVFAKPADAQSIAASIINIYKGNVDTLPSKSFLWEDTIAKTEGIYKSLVS